MTVSIIIPHWNRSSLLAELLQSIQRQSLPTGVKVEVLVVDNGSTDNSAKVAREAGVRVLQLKQNEGVSRAFNLGIAEAQGDYIALLNNDIELEPDWLDRLLKALASGSAWFATGKTLEFRNRSRIDGAGDAVCRGGTAWRLGHGKEDGPLFSSSRKTYFPSATATVFRRDFFQRAGAFEETFFAYLEDVDLGFRAAIEDLAGLYVPEAVAYHRGGETAGVWSEQMVEWLTCHQLLLVAKYYPASLLWRYGWPIFVAQSLWAFMAMSRGRTKAWARGAVRAARSFAGFRRASRSLRRQGRRLSVVLRSTEAEIAGIQRAAGWDTYWKWYFRLARTPAGVGA